VHLPASPAASLSERSEKLLPILIVAEKLAPVDPHGSSSDLRVPIISSDPFFLLEIPGARTQLKPLEVTHEAAVQKYFKK
jgi:hypothetical protein